MSVYTLPELPYDYAALEPHISAKIMELHHDKHHANYVAGANTALEKLEAAREAGDFAAAWQDFVKAGAEVYGISRDSLKSHANFRQKLELPFALVSDPDEALCTLFDVIRLKNMYGKQVRGIERSTFLINRAGVLVKEWRKVKVPGHVAEVLAAVRELHDSPSHAF